MKATRGIIACVVLSVLAISWMVASSSTRASADSDKAAIVALNRRIADAIGRGDLEAVMACYVDAKDLVFFEDTIPFQLEGTSEVRKYIHDLFLGASDIHDGMEAMSIVVSGHLAAAHYVLPVSWRDKSGAHSERGRYTQILKKVNGKWLIWH